ncbi:MAG: D-alanine--D-alanine ligase [Phycisphaerales bacterium]
MTPLAPTTTLPHVVVLGGGPDAERNVSLTSARFVAEALQSAGAFRVTNLTIDRLSQAEVRAIDADVFFPVLHGLWGEGGPLQELLEADGRPFVFSGSRASRLAMDKVATKFAALSAGIPTTPTHVLDLRDSSCPLPFPVVVKPVHEGSTIGLHVVHSAAEWAAARRAILDDDAARQASGAPARSYMIEPKITGAVQGGVARRARELTVGILDGLALPIIEIVPAGDLYDYEAKYTRSDTQYLFDTALPAGVAERIRRDSEVLARAIGVRHAARADFMLDADGTPWLLEINTIPGFTDHSLVPKAAARAGIPMPQLCARLVEMARRDAAHR